MLIMCLSGKTPVRINERINLYWAVVSSAFSCVSFLVWAVALYFHPAEDISSLSSEVMKVSLVWSFTWRGKARNSLLLFCRGHCASQQVRYVGGIDVCDALSVKLWCFVFMNNEFRWIDLFSLVLLFQRKLNLQLSDTRLIRTITWCSVRGQITVNRKFWSTSVNLKIRQEHFGWIFLFHLKEPSPKQEVSFLCLYYKIKQHNRSSVDKLLSFLKWQLTIVWKSTKAHQAWSFALYT